MKIVVLDGYTLNPGDLSWESIEALGTLIVYDRTPPALILERVDEAEVVLINKVVLDKDILAQMHHTKMVGVLATGYNTIDVEAARDLGIYVTNIPAYSTTSVAQMTFALILEICHHVGAHDRSVHEGQWSSCLDFCYWTSPLFELTGKTLGIVGMGRIGKSVAAIAQAFGMNVIGCGSNPEKRGDDQGITWVSQDRLFSESDIISLHCPLTASTAGIINRKRIAMMKDGVIIVNTSRGGLVIESDLAQALNDGKVRAAALDVVSKEPISDDNPLLKAKNCILTPHIAWAPYEARMRLMAVLEENIRGYQAGTPVNVVNGM